MPGQPPTAQPVVGWSGQLCRLVTCAAPATGAGEFDGPDEPFRSMFRVIDAKVEAATWNVVKVSLMPKPQWKTVD